jgi:hypothetical protein
MDYSAEVERTLKDLVSDAKERAQQANEEAGHFMSALDAYLARFNRPIMSAPFEASPDHVRQMKDLSYRQMLRVWAEAHDGQVIVKELVTAVASTGRFESRTKAHRSIWSAVSQATKKGEFERTGEGAYRRRAESIHGGSHHPPTDSDLNELDRLLPHDARALNAADSRCDE